MISTAVQLSAVLGPPATTTAEAEPARWFLATFFSPTPPLNCAKYDGGARYAKSTAEVGI